MATFDRLSITDSGARLSSMTVRDLLGRLNITKFGEGADSQVAALVFDSRKLVKDSIFFAIQGGKSDGHDFLQAAVDAGAAALVVEDAKRVPVTYRGTVVPVESVRRTLNKLASAYFGDPGQKLFCIGVTGTNGKTTTTHMIEAIFNHVGRSTGVIGTIDHHLGDRVWPTEMTTPDPVSFQERLREFVDLGAKVLALEVSSHALSQSRVDEVPFDVAVFTNLTRDHLDYHHDMGAYFEAKHKLFRDLLSKSRKPHPTAVVNEDDSYGRQIQVEVQHDGLVGSSGGAEGGATARARKWTYGQSKHANLRFDVQSQGYDGTRFTLHAPQGTQAFQIPMVGLHNVSNACGAIGAALAAGISLQQCADALKQLPRVNGRLDAVPNSKGLHVFVDYAHTDDALKTVLHCLNEIRRTAKIENKLITVFGCGGDRDKGKRPLMAKAALEGSDVVVLTSDNPRTENPESILDDAQAGIPQAQAGVNLFREVDRKKGIAKALQLAKPGDVVLIAGKGHEDYQIIGNAKNAFSDFEVVKEILK
jgi:UDP-N-acetylmuramoyl-L-alanyl-D-glutamate--2,6-diaminopimelate ligase